MKKLIQKWNSINLIKRIICGLIVGIILGLAIPQASVISILGDLFVGALRGIAPLLVFFLVMSSLCHMGKGQKTNMKFVVVLYLLGNILSALAAVISSRLFPIMLTFSESTNTSDVTPPSGVAEVLKNLLMNIVSNPVDALVNANYIGILAWAIGSIVALKFSFFSPALDGIIVCCIAYVVLNGIFGKTGMAGKGKMSVEEAEESVSA